MFIDNYQLRVSFMSWLKANTTILATLTDTDEIRELSWQGEKFSYPDIRITCAVVPGQCEPTDATATITYYSEEKSSKQAIQNQGIIAKQVHNKDFTSDGIKVFSIKVSDLPDAVQNEGVWEADIPLSLKANEVV